MNKRALSLLIAVVMLLSIVPITVYGNTVVPSKDYNVKVSKVVPPRDSVVNPESKISDALFKALEGEKENIAITYKGTKYIPAYVATISKIKVPEEFEYIGYAKFGDMYIYRILIPVSPESKKALLAFAAQSNVQFISTQELNLDTSELKELSREELLNSISDEAIKEKIEEFQQRMRSSKPELVDLSEYMTSKPDEVEGIQLPSVDELPHGIPAEYSWIKNLKTFSIEELMKVHKSKPLNKISIKLPTDGRTLPELDDYFVVTHDGAMNAWDTYGVDGKGVNIAIVDTGVDFGNPALMDAYAVDTNPESPYYEWPIAFDSGSMMNYLLEGSTWPESSSWYSNTSYITFPNYTILELPIVIGAKGYPNMFNYTLVFSGMSLANVKDDTEREEFLGKLIHWALIGDMPEPPVKVLVVDDDGGTNNGGYNFDVDPFYLKALDDLGIQYDLVRVNAFNDGPDYATLSQYDLVIWFTGEAWYNTLTPTDAGNLINYLSNGGRIILFGDDIIYDMNWGSFVLLVYFGGLWGVAEDWGVPTLVTDYTNEVYRAGPVNKGAAQKIILDDYGIVFTVPSFTDVYSDYILPWDTPYGQVKVIATGKMAVPFDGDYIYPWIRLPMNDDGTVPLKSSKVRIGYHPDIWLQYITDGLKFSLVSNVLVADPNEPGKYEEVYVDLITDWGLFIDFNDDEGHGKENPVIAWDLFDQNDNIGRDGLPDVSGGMVYYISDGETPIPYSDKIYETWHLGDAGIPFRIPKAGELVAFILDYYVIPHGTGCASSAVARGGRIYPAGYPIYPVYGTAPSAKIIAEPLLTNWGSWLDAMLFAAEGYDGIPNSGDDALIISNSYGNSFEVDKGPSWEDRFLYWLTMEYAPYTTILFAAGNGGPGYGTVTNNGASPGIITVGAATDWAYIMGYGVYLGTNYGDVIGWSNRGPNALGQPDPDVLATGAFGWEATYTNYLANGYYASDVFGGTSMATPVAAGITALVYQAFYNSHGRWPTSQEAKEILMSTAENVKHDVFSQGAGYLNATKAVRLALGEDGVWVSPTIWQPGRTDYNAFVNVMYPGDSDTQVFTLKNYGNEKNVKIEPMVFTKISENEISADVTGTSQYIDVTDYIPEDAELMKVTMYTVLDYASAPLVGLYLMDPATGQLEILNIDVKDGNTASVMIRNPLSRASGKRVMVRVRDYYGAEYPAKIKIEFYKRTTWEWIKIEENSIMLKDSATFTATITIPEDTPYGIYEGAIYVKYGESEVTIPVSVIVASPVANFEFGGEDREASGLYDNSHVYGMYDWAWRYETGDWRMFYFNVPESGGVIVADLTWEGESTDINLHMLGPVSDQWSYETPGQFGLYTLTEIARGCDGYLGGGMFTFCTNTGTNEEIITAPAIQGLHVLLLHNVLLDGSGYSDKFEGRVGIAKVTPDEWREQISTTYGEKTFTVTVPEFLGDITPSVVYSVEKEAYVGIIAPPTKNREVYPITVTENESILRIVTRSVFYAEDLDIDLYLYKVTDSGYVPVGEATSFGSDETIEIPAEAGNYILIIESWLNRKPGVATYDLEIYHYLKPDAGYLGIKDFKKIENGKYEITVFYNMPSEKLNEGMPLLGSVVLDSDKLPGVLTIPINLVPENARNDFAVNSIELIKLPTVNEKVKIKATVENLGPRDGNVIVKLLRDGVEIEQLTTTINIESGEYYQITFELPVQDTDIHEYKIVLESDNDADITNNEKVIMVKAKSLHFENDVVTQKVLFGYSIGKATIVKTSESSEEMRITLDGYHGSVVTLYAFIPERAIGFYIKVSGGTKVSAKEIPLEKGKILELTVKLNSPAEVIISWMSPESAVSGLNYFYYSRFLRLNQTFTNLYQKALELGVDNETLEMALNYQQAAEAWYKEGLEYMNPTATSSGVLALIRFRRAYVSIQDAIRILENAIEELEGSQA